MKAIKSAITNLDKVFIILFGLLTICTPAFFLVYKASLGDSGVLWITTPSEKFIYPLNRQQKIQVHGLCGMTKIEIDKGKFRFVDSECPGKQCVKIGWVSTPLLPVVCLPNGVSAVIQKKQKLPVDGVAM